MRPEAPSWQRIAFRRVLGDEPMLRDSLFLEMAQNVRQRSGYWTRPRGTTDGGRVEVLAR